MSKEILILAGNSEINEGKRVAPLPKSVEEKIRKGLEVQAKAQAEVEKVVGKMTGGRVGSFIEDEPTHEFTKEELEKLKKEAADKKILGFPPGAWRGYKEDKK